VGQATITSISVPIKNPTNTLLLDKLPWRFDRPVPLFEPLTNLPVKPHSPTSIPILSVARVGD